MLPEAVVEASELVVTPTFLMSGCIRSSNDLKKGILSLIMASEAVLRSFVHTTRIQCCQLTLCIECREFGRQIDEYLQGVLDQIFQFERAFTLKLCMLDPNLVKPKLV